MTVLIGGYTVFEEQFLVAVYYTSNILDREEVTFSEVAENYRIEYLDKGDRWLTNALVHFANIGWVEGPLALANLREESLSLTAAGLREAERLIEADKFFLEIADNDPVGSIRVPASNRIVSLNHNQIADAEGPLDEIVDALGADNGDPDNPGLRERLLGQIKAGRELIKSGQFRAYLLYETLVRALGEIIKRYQNPSLVALANAFLGAVVSQFFQAN